MEVAVVIEGVFAGLAPAVENLTSPVILFFVLGVVAAALRSDLEIPPAIGKALSLYLMIAIGFKGGLELARGGAWGFEEFAVAIAAVLLSLLMPWVAFALLRRTTQVDPANAAAVAATYGSVSVVTFVTAAAFLTSSGIPYAGYLVAVLALMESPAILSGLILARRHGGAAPATRLVPFPVLREALVSGSVLVLVGALAIGWFTGERGMEAVGGVLVTPFQGILAIFLLEMGLIVVRRLREAAFGGWRVVAFGVYMPLVGATFGLAIAWALGLGVGDATLLLVLAASGSYIAVPAALRHALPQADPAVYVTLSLAITFPFNVVFGIPLYHAVVKLVLGG